MLETFKALKGRPSFSDKSRRTFLVLAVVLLLVLCGGFLAFKSLKPSVLNYSDPSFGISFQYPANLHLRAQQLYPDETGGVRQLVITFSTDRMLYSNDVSEEASLVFTQYGPSDTSQPFQQVLRRELGDRQGLLSFQACSFKLVNAECLQLVDQSAWQSPPLRSKFFFRGPSFIFDVGPGLQDTYSFQDTTIQIVKTLNVLR